MYSLNNLVDLGRPPPTIYAAAAAAWRPGHMHYVRENLWLLLRSYSLQQYDFFFSRYCCEYYVPNHLFLLFAISVRVSHSTSAYLGDKEKMCVCVWEYGRSPRVCCFLTAKSWIILPFVCTYVCMCFSIDFKFIAISSGARGEWDFFSESLINVYISSSTYVLVRAVIWKRKKEKNDHFVSWLF